MIVPKPSPKGPIYWVVVRWKGVRQYERSGRDLRAAERLNATRLREVRNGTFVVKVDRRHQTLAGWIDYWTERRTSRTRDQDESVLRRFVLSRAWLAGIPLKDLSAGHIIQFLDEMRDETVEHSGKPLAAGTIKNAYALLRACLQSATDREMIPSNPAQRARSSVPTGGAKVKQPYTPSEVTSLVMTPELGAPQRMWAALAFFTGARCGEVCGLQWGDWDNLPAPLESLHVRRQYDGRPLKTEKVLGQASRRVPVHPFLAPLLAWWKAEGFAEEFGRAPLPDDPIVPMTQGDQLVAMNRKTARDRWIRACAAAGVTYRTVHASRHTFVTLCLRGGAQEYVVEKITHNAEAKRSMMAVYNHTEWVQLCAAVRCWGVTPGMTPDELSAPAWGSSPTTTRTDDARLPALQAHSLSPDLARIAQGIAQPIQNAMRKVPRGVSFQASEDSHLPSHHGAELDVDAFAHRIAEGDS